MRTWVDSRPSMPTPLPSLDERFTSELRLPALCLSQQLIPHLCDNASRWTHTPVLSVGERAVARIPVSVRATGVIWVHGLSGNSASSLCSVLTAAIATGYGISPVRQATCHALLGQRDAGPS